jgi:hypothetical protein
MRSLHDFFPDVVSQCPQQRHALGRGEGEIEPVHTALGEAASGLSVGCDPVIEPALRYLRIVCTPVSGAPIQADQLHGTAGVAGNQPRLPGYRPRSNTPPTPRWHYGDSDRPA